MQIRIGVILVFVVLGTSSPLFATADFPPEDINGDGRIDHSDVLSLLQQWYTGEIDDPTVEFGETNLEVIARRLIGAPTGSIHVSDLAKITTVHVPIWMTLESLNGINLFRNLMSLSVRYPRGGPESLDLGPLQSLHHLQSLEFITIGGFLDATVDLLPLSDLKTLTTLIVSGDEVQGATYLKSLTNLIELELSHSNINNVSFVSSLTDLLRLSLEYNDISDVSPILFLDDLRVLELDNNQISDISALQNLSHLEWINLECNNISDIRPLVDNSSLDSNTFLLLSGNPLSATSKEEYIPALESRGVGVVFSDNSLCFDFKNAHQHSVEYKEWKSNH